MPTAEEILARITANSTDSSDPVNRFTVSEDLRTISVPSGQDIIGVVGDTDVRRIWFSLPQECDGTDLSDFTPYVKYVNAQNETGMYMATDMTAEDDVLTFSWIVNQRVCVKDGTVQFSVMLAKYDTDGSTVLKEFNTVPATGVVKVGLSSAPVDTARIYVDELMLFIDNLLTNRIKTSKFMTVADSVQTFQNLPTTGNTVGQVRNVAESGRNYVWTGTAWDDLGGMDAFTVSAATDAQIDALFA